MKTSALKNVKYSFDYIREKSLEWVEYIKYYFSQRKEYRSSLIEKYSIKEEYNNNECVNTFLEERRKSILRHKYGMTIDYCYKSEASDEIGMVTLCRNDRHIDRAILTLGPDTGNGNRLIFWNFSNRKKEEK